MKKYALLMLLVLGMSSVAMGICKVDVCVNPVRCGEPVIANVKICCSGQWTSAAQHKVTPCGSIIYLDVYLKCTSRCGCMCSGPREVPLLREARCGLYMVLVRVWMDYSDCLCWPCFSFCQPILSGMGSTTFKVCCEDCGCWPCCCLFQWPCCLDGNSTVALR
ncbi:MAG: hypothetical protein JW993_11400 [Sedimentisphaerales bacterium]|nr:hypothetical protein [Sedimentisphaerales bacterium]